MGIYHVAQLALAGLVLVGVAERVYTLSFASNAHLPPIRRRLRSLLERGEADHAVCLLRAFEPAWAARCALALVEPGLSEHERIEALEDRLMDARLNALRLMRPLRVSATLGSALGFIGAAYQIHWVFNGEHGLLALEAGRIESEGLGNAVLSIAIGIATSSFALGSWNVLRKVANDRILQCRRLVASVEDALGLEQ